ncbi:MAG: ATP-dependent helicase [Microgenomates group bacterium]
MSKEEKVLNSQQKLAIEYTEGPLLIIAGAGTGKTTVITEKIKYLINSGKAKSEEILALTFTEKAAREMEERVDLALPYGYTEMWISTFHSFCDRILRAEALEIGLDPGYKLMTEAETVQFLIKNIFNFKLKYFRPLGNPNKFIEGILQHFSRLKDEDVTPEEYLLWIKNQKNTSKLSLEEKEKYEELAEAYQKYEELKVKEGVMDFSDLISNTLKLFRRRRTILKKYQQQFKYILVDEFQDTNYAQYALLKELAPPDKKPNLTVVGDDSQSIFKFRGAAISNILQFMEEYKGAKQVVLIKNYRSTQTILDHAYRLIKHNDPDTLEAKLGISKNLKAIRKTKESPIEFIYKERVEDEAEAVAEKIKFLKTKIKDLQWKDFAILVRANNHADPFVRAFIRQGIPYQFLGPGKLFRQPEVKDLIAYLKVLYNFEDNVSFYRVLSMEIFELPPRDLAAINNYALKKKISLFEACEEIEKIFVRPDTREKIKKIVAMINRHLKLIPQQTAGQILYYFLEDSGLLKKLTRYQTVKEEKQAQNISKFFDRLKTYEMDHEDASVFAVVDWINLSLELGESPLAANYDWIDEDKVNILTVHSAKGLEFRVVFLVNLVAGRFPTWERKETIPIPEALIKEILPSGDYHLQEERRLFYVGMTRARDYLFFTAANYYGEGKRERKISPFVFEALGKKPEEVFSPSSEKELQLSLLSWQTITPPEEKNNNSLPITYLSYSQIEAFNNCPLQYRYRYIQRIPIAPSAAQSFGDSLHKTLKEFYLQIKKGKKLKEEDLISLLTKNWVSEGYASKIHEKQAKEKGEEILRNFFRKEFNPKKIPKFLEQSFVIKLSPQLKIKGKIDRIDEEGEKLEIIDYKTGKSWEQKEVDKSLQMTVYALAVTDQGIFAKKPENVVLSFYFLETGEKKSTVRTKEQLEEAKKELLKKAKEIEESNFEPRPSNLCDFCEYRLLCEAWI